VTGSFRDAELEHALKHPKNWDGDADVFRAKYNDLYTGTSVVRVKICFNKSILYKIGHSALTVTGIVLHFCLQA
jgi:hypothetical protein